ncbi:hypothetical protein J3R30DRAFT_3366570 [Lentinula aciculospora]|uniref:Uncharacterized protein n=1 Tax=Lentinula aciculospora TaxID=153920 RepID=A0A9W9AMB3_9AGAR|nr:hypothetical protein J3R30DRAFT_3366570 [Lentinula aciculospora]
MSDEATEGTALLSDVPTASLPLLGDFILRLNSISPQELNQTDILQPTQLSNHRGLRASFSLLILLLIREKKIRKKALRSNPWDDWKQETLTDQWVKTIDENIEQIWTTFLSAFCSLRDIETVLWTEFRIREKGKPLRVIDFVTKHPRLLNDRVVELSLQYRWKRGAPSNPSSRQYLTPRYDKLCTPWLYHAFDLTSQITFLLLLVSYILNPPRPAFYSLPLEYIGIREIILMIFSVSAILHSWSTSLPFALTLLAFLSKVPSAPFPSDFAFNILLLSLPLLFIQLHLPFPPNPFLLFWPEQCLPLAVLIVSGVFGTIVKVSLFFLPVLLLSIFSLSYALSDIFLLPSLFMVPAPMPTRELFFIVVISIFIVLILSVLIIVLAFDSAPPGYSSWDQYSASIGQRARIQFYHSVIRYSKPYPFPPPLNILYFAFIAVPAYALPYFDISSDFLLILQQNLWRVVVGPFVVVARLLTLALP